MTALADLLLGPADEARAVLGALDAGRALAVVTRVDGERPGARLLVDDDGVRGTLGGAALDERATAAARIALAAPAHEAQTSTIEGARVLVEVHRALPELIVVGAGHISLPLARVARIAGFRVTVLDDRAEFADASRFDDDVRVVRMDASDPFGTVRPDAHAFVVLVTRAHAYDYECLRDLLRRDELPLYVGVIGSRRRVRATFAALLEEGAARERIARVRAPLGLDIGAETPEEIAISVVAEMVALRRGALDLAGAGGPLADREDVLGRFFPETK